MRALPILGVIGAIVYTSGDTWQPALGVQQDFEWSGRVDRGKTIEIIGVNGPIRATAASGDQALVTATKREGRRGDPDDVRIEVVEHGDGVTICAVYPSRDRDEPNECRPHGRGRNSVRNNDTKVEFTVRVPAGVDFVGRTVNGDVEADGLSGAVKAVTVNGDVEVSTSGVAEGRTVNGSIYAVLGSADWRGDLEFSTVNGTITVELPSGVGADVLASTVNGSIKTDFPLTVRGRWGPREMRGTIGGGGPELRLSTVNGSIRLRER